MASDATTLITERRRVFHCNWFDVIAKQTTLDPDPFYSLAQEDYVAVLAFEENERLLVVEQFRPAVEQITLELPSGTIENGESPEQAARRELSEETGCAAGELEFLGTLWPDAGRLQSRMWCYSTRHLGRVPAWMPEPGIRVTTIALSDIPRHVRDGSFVLALHMAVLQLYAMRQSAR